jgi:hypothetical protein
MPVTLYSHVLEAGHQKRLFYPITHRFHPKKLQVLPKGKQPLMKPIGKGAYGTVYQAKMMHPPFADRVVKVIQKRLVRNPESLKNEYMILKKLDHPNIVKLY